MIFRLFRRRRGGPARPILFSTSLGSDLDLQWNAAHFPIVVFESRRDLVAVIHLEFNARGFELGKDFIGDRHHFTFLRIVFVDGHDDDLNGCKPGGRINPWSSPCTMMIVPIMRVESPHEVVEQYCSVLFLSRY